MSIPGDAKSRMDRIMRLHDQIDDLKADIREVYAEEKASGGDKTAMGAAISYLRKRAKDGTALAEREAMMDVYLVAYDAPVGTPVATHTHARDEEFPPHDPVTGELAEEESEPAHAVRSEARDSVAGTVLSEGREPAERSSDESSAPIHETPADPSVQATAAGEVNPPPASPASIRSPAITAGADGHRSVPRPDARVAGRGEAATSSVADAQSDQAVTQSKADDFDIGDVPDFLRRTDGYAAASGRGA